MNELIDALSKALQQPTVDDQVQPLFSGEGYTPIPFSADYAKPLTPFIGKKSRKTVFIDGGNAELFSSQHFSLSLVRLAYGIYEQKKRIKTEKAEFYVLVTSSHDEDITFRVKIFPIRGQFFPKGEYAFNSFDKTLCLGKRRSSISMVSNVIRRFGELDIATQLCPLLTEHDRMVLDGSLQASYTGEDKHLEQLFSQGKNITIIALNKSTSLFTTKGMSFDSFLQTHLPSHPWAYDKVAEHTLSSTHPCLSFVNLHPKAKKVFMIESNKELEGEEFNSLAYYATDPVFLGYPYGLIEADRMARVSKQEIQFLKTKLLSMMKGVNIEKSSFSVHDVLDSLQF